MTKPRGIVPVLLLFVILSCLTPLPVAPFVLVTPPSFLVSMRRGDTSPSLKSSPIILKSSNDDDDSSPSIRETYQAAEKDDSDWYQEFVVGVLQAETLEPITENFVTTPDLVADSSDEEKVEAEAAEAEAAIVSDILQEDTELANKYGGGRKEYEMEDKELVVEKDIKDDNVISDNEIDVNKREEGKKQFDKIVDAMDDYLDQLEYDDDEEDDDTPIRGRREERINTRETREPRRVKSNENDEDMYNARTNTRETREPPVKSVDRDEDNTNQKEFQRSTDTEASPPTKRTRTSPNNDNQNRSSPPNYKNTNRPKDSPPQPDPRRRTRPRPTNTPTDSDNRLRRPRPKSRQRMKEEPKFWMPIDDFRENLRNEASLRLNILGPNYKRMIKSESEWRLWMYEKWLGLLDKGIDPDDWFMEEEEERQNDRRRKKTRGPQEEERRRRPVKNNREQMRRMKIMLDDEMNQEDQGMPAENGAGRRDDVYNGRIRKPKIRVQSTRSQPRDNDFADRGDSD